MLLDLECQWQKHLSHQASPGNAVCLFSVTTVSGGRKRATFGECRTASVAIFTGGKGDCDADDFDGQSLGCEIRLMREKHRAFRLNEVGPSSRLFAFLTNQNGEIASRQEACLLPVVAANRFDKTGRVGVKH